jgi:hypothetical protein
VLSGFEVFSFSQFKVVLLCVYEGLSELFFYVNVGETFHMY